MTKMQKPTFLVQRGSAARLVAAIALATFGCANYVQASAECNQTYDTVTYGDDSCINKGTTSTRSYYSPSAIRQCRESKFLYTNQRCTMSPFTVSVVITTFNGSICSGDWVAQTFTNEATTNASFTDC